MSEIANLELLKERLSKLETEASNDIQENQYLSEKLRILSSRIRQVTKIIESNH